MMISAMPSVAMARVVRAQPQRRLADQPGRAGRQQAAHGPGEDHGQTQPAQITRSRAGLIASTRATPASKTARNTKKPPIRMTSIARVRIRPGGRRM